MRSNAQAETNFRHRRDMEAFSGAEDVERHPGYLGHVTLSVACRDTADAHVHRRYRLHLVDVVALYQPVHETVARSHQTNAYNRTVSWKRTSPARVINFSCPDEKSTPDMYTFIRLLSDYLREPTEFYYYVKLHQNLTSSVQYIEFLYRKIQK